MDAVGRLVIVMGAVLVVLAAAGVIKFPDLYSRMHAATKAPALGLLLVAVGTLLSLDEGRVKLLLAAALILVTAPVASHLIGRSAYRASGIDVRVDAIDELGATMVGDGGPQPQPEVPE